MKDFWIEIVGLILGAGGLGAFLTFNLGKRKQNTSDFQIIVEKYEKLNDEYKAESDFCRQARVGIPTGSTLDTGTAQVLQ